MSTSESEQSVERTLNKISALQTATPESAAQKGSINRYLAFAKNSLEDVQLLQHALNSSETLAKSEVLESQIKEVREILRKASELLFKELNSKLINDAEIEALQKTLYGLDVLYETVYNT